MIRLKHLLTEQLITEQNPFAGLWDAIQSTWNTSVKDTQTRSLPSEVAATIKNDVDRVMRSGKYAPETRAEIIAFKIVTNGGWFVDDEPAMVEAFESIKSIKEYNDVNAAIYRETNKRARTTYKKATDLFLGYFDNNQFDLHLRVLKHMMKLGGGYLAYRNSPIASDMYEYSAQLIVNHSYRSDIIDRGSSQPGVDQNSSASIFGWYKKYMYPETWQKWVDGEQKRYKNFQTSGIDFKQSLNPLSAAEEAVYGSSSWISQQNLQIVQSTLVIASMIVGQPEIATGLIATSGAVDITNTWNQYKQGKLDETTAGLFITLQLLPGPDIAGSQLSSNAKNYLKSSKNILSLSKKLQQTTSALTPVEQEIARTLNSPKTGFNLEKTIGRVRNNAKNRGVLPDEAELLGPGAGQFKLKNLYKNKNTGAVIGAYGRDAAEGVDVFLALPNPNVIDKYIAYKNVSDSFNPKFSIKADLDPGTTKQLLTDISTILPYHRLTETHSISTDGIKFWGSQIKNGYRISNTQTRIKLNNAGSKTKLPGAYVKPGQDKFNTVYFNNIKDAEAAATTVRNLFKQQNIPATVTISRPPTPPPAPNMGSLSLGQGTFQASSRSMEYSIDIILPELESTFKSLQNNGISRVDIDPAYLKKATRLQ
jgi:hypothetical protein